MDELLSYSRSSFEWGVVDVVFGLMRPVDRRSGYVSDEQLEKTGSIPQLISLHLLLFAADTRRLWLPCFEEINRLLLFGSCGSR
jgi:hypothetical protein